MPRAGSSAPLSWRAVVGITGTIMSELRTEAPTAKAGEYVLPKPPRGGELPLQIVSTSGTSASLRRAEAAKVLGARTLGLVECQQQFLGEVRERLRALDVAIAEDSRARLKGAVRAAAEVLDWCDAVQQDLQREAMFASLGWMPHDLDAFCAELAANHPAGGVAVGGTTHSAWWGDGPLLAATLAAAMDLVQERTAGRGTVLLELDEQEGVHSVRVTTAADVVEEANGDAVLRFRALASRIGAAVVPDRLGACAPGLVLRLPTPVAP